MVLNVQNILLNMIRLFLDYLSIVIFKLIYWNGSEVKIPPTSNSIVLESATSLALKIRKRKFSSEEVVKAFIHRIEEVNPILNSVIQTRFDEAVQEAQAVDVFLRSSEFNEEEISETKPFLGVPFTIKDSFGVSGLKLTSGLYERRDVVAEEDAEVVQLMKKAGAIILGMTNVPEMLMWWETSNTLYGRTNNPYDVTRSSGGSSGGEGSIVSACGSAMGIGSDIGGSIRMPCLFNGIFGHKPTSGIVSNLGKFPETVGERNNFLVTGPMCRFACDIAPMLKVMAGPNAGKLSLDNEVNMKNIRVYYSEDRCGGPLVGPVDNELILAQRKVLKYLQHAYDIQPVKIHLLHVERALKMFFAKLRAVKGTQSFCSLLSSGEGEINVWLEVIKCLFRLSIHTLPALAFGVVEKFPMKGSTEVLEECESLKLNLMSLLSDDSVLLYSSHATTAPYHSQSMLRPFNYAYTALFNVLELPVTQCPLGLNAEGLPLGIQVIANKYQDHLCIAVAQEIEKAFGGWVNPSSDKFQKIC